MIKNFLTVTIRSFFRQKLYSIINVAGLASGLLCVLFIYLWVADELSKDKFHENTDEIYRVVSNLHMDDGEILTWAVTPGLLAEDINDNIHDVEMAVRTSETGQMLFEFEGEKFSENGYFADPEFFQLFSFRTLHGKPFTAKEISSVAISEELATKIFESNEKAIGKTILLNGRQSFTVSSVFENPSDQSTLQFSFIIPYEIYRKNRGDGFSWNNYDHPLFVKLDPGVVNTVTAMINERAAKRAADDGSKTEFYLQPFKDAYLYGHFENGMPVGGRIEYIRIFVIVGIFMLVIACINFTNVATARAAFRAKEVGIRKVVGAYRRSLISQFILESVLVSFIAMLLALGMAYTFLPAFNILVSKEIILDLGNIRFLLGLVGIVLITGFLAGSYPAFFLSAYQPAQVLKGGMSKSFSGSSLRKLLVVFQFSLTVILIASSIVIYAQIEFIRNKDIGYERQSVLWFQAPRGINSQFDVFRNEIGQVPGITKMGKANESLVQVNNQNSSVSWPGKDEKNSAFFRTVVVDFEYMETMGLQLQQGRFFSTEHNDTSNFVLTQRAVEIMGLHDPIGTTISQWGVSGKVVGVVGDFHSRSLQESLDPVVFMCKPEWTSTVFVRFQGDHVQESIAGIEQIFKKYSGDSPFQYYFLEDDFEKMYNTEKVTGILALGFTVMAVIISGLGLIGLAAYTAERRRKEISIRKTLGASVSGIIAMISGDFLKLSLIAALIGCPVAYYLMSEFLSDYAFHTELSWKVFALTAVCVTAICILTVIFQVMRAALANPVDALRNE